VAGTPPLVNFELERHVQTACRDGIRRGWVRSAHDCAEGGLAVALAECCISGRRGADVTLGIETLDNEVQPISGTPQAETCRLDTLLFGEGGARILVSIAPAQVDAWEAYLTQQLGSAWQQLGRVGSDITPLSLANASGFSIISASITDMGDRWATAIERRLAL